MIIIQLLGGLGNQMFQYAAARRLAHEKSVPLRLDIREYAGNPDRAYKLNHFNIAGEIASAEELARFNDLGNVAKASRALERHLLPRTRRRIYQERTPFIFEPEFLSTPKDVYLQGYFQNELYFKSIESLIRQDFVVSTPFDSRNEETAERIRRVQSVSLHIRRGDYATNAETRSIHGLLPLDYYQTAVQHIAESVDQPHFFVFSDDPIWACDHLRLDFPLTVVDYNGAEHDFEDMRLLSLCQHHIIANSSFSWWGAWLCEFPDKIVCAPNRWLQDLRYDTHQVVPRTWHRIGA